MNTVLKWVIGGVITLVVLGALIFAAFIWPGFLNAQPQPAVATSAPATKVLSTVAATSVSLAPTLTPIPVATTVDAGQVLAGPPVPIEITPMVPGTIDWNEQLMIKDWVLLPGLVPGTKLQYVQSDINDTLTLTNFQVPAGTELIFGAVSMTATFEDAKGNKYDRSFDGGVYGVIPAGTKVLKFAISNGFAALVLEPQAQQEFCARVAQAVAEKWADTYNFPDPVWKKPICTGTYSVPVDSDRVHGGLLPVLPTATP